MGRGRRRRWGIGRVAPFADATRRDEEEKRRGEGSVRVLDGGLKNGWSKLINNNAFYYHVCHKISNYFNFD